MFLRLASIEEADACYQCIEDARAYHKSLGFEQWKPDYPTKTTVTDDIRAHRGYVFCNEDELLGYCCIMIGDEPTYRSIKGAWATDRDYIVIHRIAFNRRSRGKHLSVEAFSLLKKFCIDNKTFAIRIDTHEENKVMQHILARENFTFCGVIQVNGSPRLAYEWDC